MLIVCKICEEKLDKRDLIKPQLISCWKCGWKKEVEPPDSDDVYDDYYEMYFGSGYWENWD